MITATKHSPSKRNLRQALADEQGKLIEEIKGYAASPLDVMELFDFLAKFYNYSFGNAALIRKQWPGALAVASYHDWQKRGCAVKKGEHSQIKIWVPTTITFFINADGKRQQLKYATKQEKQLIKAGKISVTTKRSFKVGSVFDVSQTTAKPSDYPKLMPNRPFNFASTTEQREFVQKGLDAYAEALHVRVVKDTDNQLQSANGEFIPKKKLIVMSTRITAIQHLTTLIHELAHATLHARGKVDRPTAEMQAEMVAYLVAKHFKINMAEKAVRYIAGWTDNFKNLEADDLKQVLTDVQFAAMKIIKVINRANQ